MSLEEKNAIIESASLDIERGMLSSFVHLRYASGGQGFGGFCLYTPKGQGQNFAGHWIYRVLEIAGVERWADLPGKTVRVKSDWERVDEIGHVLNDDWFNPKKEFERMQKPWEQTK